MPDRAYSGAMNDAATLVRRHGLDALVVVAGAGAILELAARHEAGRAPETPLWFSLAAVALVVFPLLARRRFPFAAPAASAHRIGHRPGR